MWARGRRTARRFPSSRPAGAACSRSQPRAKAESLLLASAGPLQNGQLAKADNARLGIALAGAKARRIVFAESYHGYGAVVGPRRDSLVLEGALSLSCLLPSSSWSPGVGGSGLPEPDVRELSPPRRDYVDALATTMARTRDRGNAADGTPYSRPCDPGAG